LATKAVREFEKPNLEQQAIAAGRPVVELERERRAIFADAKVLNPPYQPKPQGFKNTNNSKKKSQLFRE
jgi:hypothetical protein